MSETTTKKLPTICREDVRARLDVRGSREAIRMETGKFSNIINGEGRHLLP